MCTLSWETINKIADQKILKLSYVILFGVPLLSLISDAASSVNFRIPVSQNLKFLYISNLLLAASVFLNAAFCPKIVSSHHDLVNYILHLCQLAGNIGDILTKIDDSLKESIAKEVGKLDLSGTDASALTNSKSELSKRLFDALKMERDNKTSNAIRAMYRDPVAAWEAAVAEKERLRSIISIFIYLSGFGYFFFGFLPTLTRVWVS